MAIAFQRAGLDATADKGRSALHLFNTPRLRARVEAILEARSKQPPISLSEVTDMLKRVYVGAVHDTEYGAAHNAAFSLARLHGLVIDRAQLDVIRRPSREPDAPAELALGDWIAALPSGPAPPRVVSRETRPEPSGVIIEGTLCGSDLDAKPLNTLDNPGPAGPQVPPVNVHTPGLGDGRAGTENGAPGAPVTGTPSTRAFSTRAFSTRAFSTRAFSTRAFSDGRGVVENGSLFNDEGTGLPSAEDLF